MTVFFYGSEFRRMPADLTGMAFGRWIVRYYAGVSKGTTLWFCECECKRTAVVRANNLRNGRSQSCGCIAAGKASQRMRTHGATVGERSAEYEIWCGIKQRCLNPNNERYASYGGRGITICDRWRANYANFIDAMGPRPTRRHTVERRDNNGNYEPDNCSWETYEKQANNTRRNHLVVVYGERMTLSEAAKRFGCNYGTLSSRLKAGQSIEQALELAETVKERVDMVRDLTADAA